MKNLHHKITQAWLFFALLGANFSAFSAASEVQSLSPSLEPSNYITQISLSLIFILLIIFAAAWLLKRFGRINGLAGAQMKVLGVMSLGQRERVVLMEVGKKQLLIGVTASRVSLLHELEERVEIEESQPVGNAFAKRLQEALNKKESS